MTTATIQVPTIDPWLHYQATEYALDIADAFHDRGDDTGAWSGEYCAGMRTYLRVHGISEDQIEESVALEVATGMRADN